MTLVCTPLSRAGVPHWTRLQPLPSSSSPRRPASILPTALTSPGEEQLTRCTEQSFLFTEYRYI